MYELTIGLALDMHRAGYEFVIEDGVVTKVLTPSCTGAMQKERPSLEETANQ